MKIRKINLHLLEMNAFCLIVAAPYINYIFFTLAKIFPYRKFQRSLGFLKQYT